MNKEILKIVYETRGCHCLAARRRARELTRLYEEALRPLGLRATQFSVLAALMQTGPFPVTKIADILGLERTTLTRIAGVMERNGWLKAGLSKEDNRIRTLAITVEGKKVLTRTLPAWKRAQDMITNNKQGGT